MARAESRGRFITLEGVDGAGKSTHLAWMAGRLRAAGGDVLVTREPGGTPLAEKLRGLVLADPMDAVTETLLMFAARADHVAQVIRPALERGATVVCDRFTDATLAYQAAGKGVDEALVRALAEATHPGLQPDLTLVFDVPYAVSQARMAKAARVLDRFESAAESYFERVRQGYRRLAAEAPARVKVIDASRSLEEVQSEIRRVLG